MGVGELVLILVVLCGLLAVLSKRNAPPLDVEKLRHLQELHERGALSPEEFERAKAAALEPRPSKAAHALSVAVAVVGVLFIGYRFFGNAGAKRVAASLAKAPIVLVDEVQNVTASSWRAVPINVPYAGELTLKVDVKRGNDLLIAVIDEDALTALKANKQHLELTAFSAVDTRSVLRRARVAPGVYYVVARDRTLGILSANSTDYALMARLDP